MAISYRGLLKFLRDPARMVSTVVFPLIFIGALGGSLQATFGRAANFNLLEFTFTGVFAQTLFNPMANLPWYLEALSRISPLRYSVDLVRGVYYAGHPDYGKIVLDPPLLNLAMTAVLFVVFLGVGTVLFVRHERNR